jgi:hypothetical protein
MPRYRFSLPVRAIGSYRLPEAGATAHGVTMTQGVSIHQRTAGILRIESYPLPRVIHEGRTQ